MAHNVLDTAALKILLRINLHYQPTTAIPINLEADGPSHYYIVGLRLEDF